MLEGDGHAIVGRVLVLDHRVHVDGVRGPTDVLSVVADARPHLRELDTLLAEPAPDDPAWAERTRRVRDGLRRLSALSDRLERDAREAAGD